MNKINLTLPHLDIPARRRPWIILPALLLALLPPACALAASPQDAQVTRPAANNNQPPGGFGLVSTQWCNFYPQLPFCPNSGTTVSAAPSAAPPGMGFVPINWCNLVPTLPICPSTSSLPEVTGFGSNPGNLRMFRYAPQGLPPSSPLVVALHGCTQQASSYDDEAGWIKYADKHGFAVLLPQATVHQVKCFRWFDPNNNERDKGEALSIRQMIEKMKTDLNIDPKRIYVTGLSAGGAMTAAMLAAYPEVFAGGGINAGIAYKCAGNENEARNCGVLFSAPMAPEKKALTPSQWGEMVRRASGSSGPFPRVAIWQGDADRTVNKDNLAELMEQWTDVHRIGQTPGRTDTLNGNGQHPVTRQIFTDAAGKALVETYLVKGMDHGTAIGPGQRDDQCGKAAPFILDMGICSTFFIGKFWGLIP